MAPINPAAGKYNFTAIVMNGKRLEWVLNYQDDKNYDLFQMDDKNLVRTQVVNGKKGPSVKIPHSIKININKDYVTSQNYGHAHFDRPQLLRAESVAGRGQMGEAGRRVGGEVRVPRAG